MDDSFSPCFSWQLSEVIRSKDKRETQVMEELAGLRDSLRAEEQARFEVSEERERLTKQLGDMDACLQVLIIVWCIAV
jgi:hypothetical protein